MCPKPEKSLQRSILLAFQVHTDWEGLNQLYLPICITNYSAVQTIEHRAIYLASKNNHDHHVSVFTLALDAKLC